jgi:hypothetical protein
MIVAEHNSNGPMAKTIAARFRNQISWRNLLTCPCHGRQIRHRLIIVDLFVWVLIISIAIIIWKLI